MRLTTQDLVHSEAPGEEMVPVEQGVQEETPPAEKVFAGQIEHEDALSPLKVPAGQVAQARALMYVPAKQVIAIQLEDPCVETLA